MKVKSSILIVTPIFPPEIGGPASYVSELARRISWERKVKIICFSPSVPTPIPNVIIHRISTKGSSLTRQWNLARTIWVNAREVSTLYIQGTLTVGLIAALIGKIARKKVILKYVGDEVWELARNRGNQSNLESFLGNPPTPYNFLLFLERIVFKLADLIITPSNYLKKIVTDFHSLSPQKITVIPNAFNFTTSKNVKIKHQICFIGRLVAWKHVDECLEALSIARQTTSWKLVIVGEGPEKSRLLQLVQELKLEDAVTFTGALTREETQAVIAASEKLLLYSSYEGQPHVLLEAMAAETSVVASDILPNRELVGVFGELVTPHDPIKLAKAINKPTNSTHKAQDFVRGKFSWENHLKQLEKVFN